MNRMKAIRMAVLLALIAGPLAAWLAPAAYAQGGTLAGTVFDLTGKPYPDVTITIKNIETNKETSATTDAKGHYSAPGLGAGTYNIDVKGKDKDQKVIASVPPAKLKSGSGEIRNWIALAGAMESLNLNWSDYVPCYRSPAGTGTGIAFAVWE